MLDRLDAEMQVSRAALNLRSYRQQLLASNIANADTPHYKATDIDFKSALAANLGASASASINGVELSRTHAAHIAGDEGVAAAPNGVSLKYRTEYQGAVDGNTVNMDIERSAFVENSVHLEAMLTFVRGRLKDMQTAIQGQ